MRQYLYSYNFCCDKKYIWVIDFIIHGLMRIDRKTYEMVCILSPMKLYKNGYFSICKLLDWEKLIVMIPTEMNKNWILYDKSKGKIEYFSPISAKFCCGDAVRMGNQIFCLPLSAHDPIAIVNMDVKKCVNVINHWNEKSEGTFFDGEIWNTVKAKDVLYFPIRGSKYIGATDGFSVTISETKINALIGAADFYQGYWWITAMDDTTLYCVDIEGEILERFSLHTDYSCVRLIAAERFIFMLPEKDGDIEIFDRNAKKSREINEGVTELLRMLPEQVYTAPYWHYLCEEDHIIFLPHKYPCTVVDINTLQTTYQEIVYSEEFTEKYYWKFYRDMYKLCCKDFFSENEKDSVGNYIFSTVNTKENDSSKSEIGERVWSKCAMR